MQAAFLALRLAPPLVSAALRPRLSFDQLLASWFMVVVRERNEVTQCEGRGRARVGVQTG